MGDCRPTYRVNVFSSSERCYLDSQLYMREILRLRRILRTIVLDWDTRIVSNFWRSLQRSFGIELAFGIAYIPKQIDKMKGPIILLRTCFGLVVWIIG